MARGWRGIFVSTLLVVSAGCSAAQQQQQQAALPSATADEMFTIIARAVQQELRPVVRKLESQVESLDKTVRRHESRMESLDNRLTLLDSRMSTLTAHVLTNRLGEQMDEMSSQLSGITARLDSQQSQLDSQLSQLSELNTQLNEQKSQQEKTAATVNNVTAQLIQILGSQLAETMNKTAASQESIDHSASEVKQPPTSRDCSDIPVGSPSGVYLLRPSGDSKQPPVQSYCDMDTAGGNWTVIQRRDDIEPRQDFYLGWKEYKEGFGDATKEFWWGLNHLFQLTSSNHRRYELHIELQAFDESQRYATYQQFRISSEVDGYTLSYTDYSGNAGDSLYRGVNKKFSTRDRGQDPSGVNCAQVYQGAWWYGECGESNLNGRYRDGGVRDWTGIWWVTWKRGESLKKTVMKIRPT